MKPSRHELESRSNHDRVAHTDSSYWVVAEVTGHAGNRTSCAALQLDSEAGLSSRAPRLAGRARWPECR